MEAPIHESAPSTSQEDTKSNGLNLQNLALNNIPPWAKLVLGSVVLLAIPLYRRVLRTQKSKKSVEAAVEAAEKAAEAAEKLAEAAEKVAEAAETMVGKVLEAFPGGRLMKEEAAVFVDKNADIADSKINKI